MQIRRIFSKSDAGAALKAAYERKTRLVERIREGATANELEQEGYRMVKFV